VSTEQSTIERTYHSVTIINGDRSVPVTVVEAQPKFSHIRTADGTVLQAPTAPSYRIFDQLNDKEAIVFTLLKEQLWHSLEIQTLI
jgi:hypothetical protein